MLIGSTPARSLAQTPLANPSTSSERPFTLRKTAEEGKQRSPLSRRSAKGGRKGACLIACCVCCALVAVLATAPPAPAIDAGSVSSGSISIPNLAGVFSNGACLKLRISGRVFAPGEPLPKGARIVRLWIKASTVPMVLDSQPDELGDLRLERRSDCARELYHAILIKRVRVMADDQILARLLPAAHAFERLRVDGDVRLVASPILLVDSVRRAR